MHLGINNSSLFSMDTLIGPIIVVILASIAYFSFADYKDKARIAKACELIAGQMKPADSDEEKAEEMEPEGESKTYAPGLAIEGENLTITEHAAEIPTPGTVLKLSSKQEVLFSDGKVEITGRKHWFARFVICPILILIGGMLIMTVVVEFIREKDKKTALPGGLIGFLFGLVLLLAAFWNILGRTRITVTEAGVQKSRAWFGGLTEPKETPMKSQGFAWLKDGELLAGFSFDKEGELVGEVIAKGKPEDLYKVCAALNGVIPDTEVKGVLTTNDTNSTNDSEEKSGGGDITTENTEDTEGSDGGGE